MDWVLVVGSSDQATTTVMSYNRLPRLPKLFCEFSLTEDKADLPEPSSQNGVDDPTFTDILITDNHHSLNSPNVWEHLIISSALKTRKELQRALGPLVSLVTPG